MPAESSVVVDHVPVVATSVEPSFDHREPPSPSQPLLPSPPSSAVANNTNGCVKFLAPDNLSSASSLSLDHRDHGGSVASSAWRPLSSSSGGAGSGAGQHVRTQSETSAVSNDESVASSSANTSAGDNSTEFAITPPDGGWGWVVVFAAFITNVIADGVTFSFGILYVDFLEYFGQSKAKTAWVGSLFMGVPLLAGPIASTLTDRFGCRKVTIAGALLASVGFVVSSFVDSLEVLFFTFGIVSGFGLALANVAAIVIVAYYFEKRRAFATGLSVCGSGIGTFLFAPFTHFLREQYAWRGATLILAGCFLNIVVCGALMRDLEGTTRKFRSEKSLKTSLESISAKSQTTPDESRRLLQGSASHGAPSSASIPEDLKDCERLCNSLVQLPTFLNTGENLPKELIEKMGKQGVNYEYFMENYPHLLSHSASDHLLALTAANADFPPNNNVLLSPTSLLDGATISPTTVATATTIEGTTVVRHPDVLMHRPRGQPARRLSAAYFHNLKLHRRSMTHRNAMLNTRRYHIRASSCPDIYRNSMITIAQEEEDEVCSFMEDVKEALLNMVDVSYFRNLKFLIFCISNLLLYFWYDITYVYLAAHAIELGVHQDTASYLISIIGILNTFGEILYGYIGDKPWASSMVIYSVSTAICGAVMSLIPLTSTFTELAIIASIFGFTISSNYALTSIILVDLITLERFTNAYGLLLLIQGISNLLGPPLAGWLHDITGSYNLSFYMAGFWVFISGALIIVLPIWRWIQRHYLIEPENTKISHKGKSHDGHVTGGGGGGGKTKIYNQTDVEVPTLEIGRKPRANHKEVVVEKKNTILRSEKRSSSFLDSLPIVSPGLGRDRAPTVTEL